MRVVIASRIYAPEVSAASGLLQSWAAEFRDRGCAVTVVTTRVPGQRPAAVPGIRVRRAPVLRDRQHYVRGYLPYLSFDLPLLFRLLFSRPPDLYVVEPPPTTIAVVVAVAWLQRRPVVVDAADLWADAASMVTRSTLVLGALRRLELWALRRATHLFAAHEPLVARARELGIATPATAIGFGADTDTFCYTERPLADPPLFVYAGTHSEWHGAVIFVEAFAVVLGLHPAARLLIVGNGADRDLIRARCEQLGLGASVELRPPVSPAALAPMLCGATASLASVKPGRGYDYAFATKVYSSLAAGCPVIFAGVGPTVAFLTAPGNPRMGVTVPFETAAVAAAMLAAVAAPLAARDRLALSLWSARHCSLSAIAARVVDQSLAIAAG